MHCTIYRALYAVADGEKGLEEEGLSATVKARTSSFFSDLTRTLKEPVFVCTMFGYAVYTGACPWGAPAIAFNKTERKFSMVTPG